MLELLREASCTGKPEHGSGGEGGHGGEDDAFGGEVGHAGKPADGPGELAIPGTPSASSGGASRDGSACKPADGLGKLADGLGKPSWGCRGSGGGEPAAAVGVAGRDMGTAVVAATSSWMPCAVVGESGPITSDSEVGELLLIGAALLAAMGPWPAVMTSVPPPSLPWAGPDVGAAAVAELASRMPPAVVTSVPPPSLPWAGLDVGAAAVAEPAVVTSLPPPSLP